MMKQILSKKSIVILSTMLMIVGIGCGIIGFAMAKNNTENLKTGNSDAWYQTVHVNDENEFRIYLEIGPISIMSFGH
ncbi:hypothetical protein [Anaerorhabdus sp.]|uniref:Uncharacterized protein n=1 Tax=bioreactor metagenome TaxID=1076179 RepID=A0A645G6C0_9ZZZZ|nr:hypothetical protein [Anaerorhabdus sp.]MEA4875691.1 hypothetical protein [Anaerorhabdus sp.]